MCDLAHAALYEQFDQDGRAVIAAGGSENPPQFYRDALWGQLSADLAGSRREGVSAEQHELEEALGVA